MGNCFALCRPNSKSCAGVLQIVKSMGGKTSELTEPAETAAEASPAAGEVKRIKVVITRQQLQDLLSRQVVSVEDVISGAARMSSHCLYLDSTSSSCCWKPKLEPIPEGI